MKKVRALEKRWRRQLSYYESKGWEASACALKMRLFELQVALGTSPCQDGKLGAK